MAKETGLGWSTLSVDDSSGTVRDIRNDVTDLTISTPRAVFDTTGVDKSAHERLLGLADASIGLNGVFNPAANQSHSVLRTVPSTSVARTISLTVSGQSLPGEYLIPDYNLKRGNSGELTWSVTAQLADGSVPTWS